MVASETEHELIELKLVYNSGLVDHLVPEYLVRPVGVIAPLHPAFAETWFESTLQSFDHFAVELLRPVVVYETATTSSVLGSPPKERSISIVANAECVDSNAIWIGASLCFNQLWIFADHPISEEEDPLLAIEVKTLRRLQRI